MGGIWVRSTQHDVEHRVCIARREGDGLVDVQLAKKVLQFYLWGEF